MLCYQFWVRFFFFFDYLEEDLWITDFFVAAPPHLGDDETIETVRGLVVTMNCNPRDDGLKSTITWMKVREQKKTALSIFLHARFFFRVIKKPKVRRETYKSLWKDENYI